MILGLIEGFCLGLIVGTFLSLLIDYILERRDKEL